MCLWNQNNEISPKQTHWNENDNGELWLGHNNTEIKFQPILNQPEGFVYFYSGYNHSLFLDQDESVYSVVYNEHAKFGLGHTYNENKL